MGCVYTFSPRPAALRAFPSLFPSRSLAMASPPASCPLDVELFAQGARELTLARDTRPKNANKAYDPKQREWRGIRRQAEGIITRARRWKR